MPKPIHVFQFMSMQSPALTERLLRKVRGADATIVFDLEDTIGNLRSPEQTPRLKEEARRNLVDFVTNLPEWAARARFGVRVNGIASPEFAADVLALQQASAAFSFACIVLPKTASADDLRAGAAALHDHAVRSAGVVPIVETVDGLPQLGAIARAGREAGVTYIIYGHYDYSLDGGEWPFLQFDEASFWERADRVIAQIEDEGLRYVHSPYTNLNDQDGLRAIWERLSHRCRDAFGMMTISANQTIACNAFSEKEIPAGWQDILRPPASRSHTDKLAEAAALIDCYNRHAKPGNTYAVEPTSGRFITPHEYLAARKYVEAAQ